MTAFYYVETEPRPEFAAKRASNSEIILSVAIGMTAFYYVETEPRPEMDKHLRMKFDCAKIE